MTRKATTKARTFDQDLMRGEHQLGAAKAVHTASLKGGTTFGMSTGAYDGRAGQDAEPASSGTSIFDPVLCELAYRWFCPPGGVVLDPFAGGSVRGVVAAKLGRQYVGCDLRPEQVDANRLQWDAIAGEGNPGEPDPVWHVGDSREIERHAAGVAADFVFSCPPYADLEVYSENPADLSTLEYDEFRAAYAAIIAASCRLLKQDRFACFVVGDVRDRRGFYYGFPWHTVEAFQLAGLRLYNEAVLVTAVGSLPVRAGKQFTATRKLGKTHQNVLVFVKGDPRKATEAVGPVEFGEVPEAAEPGEGGVAAEYGEVL